MKIFANKTPRTWKSSGVLIKSDQLEMSNFSFLEESFISSTSEFIITIVGKNLIGNGAFSIAIYKDSFLVWQEEMAFDGISFSKKQIKIQESPGESFRVIISRGKKSKGKILLNQVLVYGETKKESKKDPNTKNKVTKEVVADIFHDEDEPTFFLEDPPIAISIDQNIDDIFLPEETNNRSDISYEEVIKTEALEEPIVKAVPKINKKRRIRYIKIASISQGTAESIPTDIISEKRATKDIWVSVIDFGSCNDERAIFNFLNQISFGRDRQIFFVKQSELDPIDFSKYEHVRIFNSDDEIIKELEMEWPRKITFVKENLNPNLLAEVERIKLEVES